MPAPVDQCIRLAVQGRTPLAPTSACATTRSLAGHGNIVECMTFTPDGKTLISADHGWGAKLIFWDLPDGRAIQSHDVGDFVEGLCISGDGQTLAVFSQSKRVYTFHLPGGDPHIDFDPHGEFIGAIALSPDGRMLVTGGKWKVFPKLWSLPEGKLLHTFPMAVNTCALQFSPDGRLLVCAAENELVSLWSVPDGKLVKTLADEVAGVYTNDLAFSRRQRDPDDGRWQQQDPVHQGCQRQAVV